MRNPSPILVTPILAAAALALSLAACGPKPAAPAPPAPMPRMDMAGNAMMANGVGTVVEIDKAAGTVTLSHGAIPKAGWPAMTMAFKANPPSLLDTVNVGDRVAFDLKLTGGTGEVTAIRKP